MDPFTIIGGVTAAAGLAGSLLSKPKRAEVPDISREIARIAALYAKAREVAAAGITKRGQEARGVSASNLAARGIYSSPVSENVFGKIREGVSSDLAASDANIGAAEADQTSRLLASLLGANLDAQKYNSEASAARTNEIFGGLGSLGSTLLMAGLGKSKVPGVAATQNWDPMGQSRPAAMTSQPIYPIPKYGGSNINLALARLFGRP